MQKIEFKIAGKLENIDHTLPFAPLYKRSWRHHELVSVFPDMPIKILDLGAGDSPIKARDGDKVITIDFAVNGSSEITVDVTKVWPFEDETFDLIYSSHVLEHFYPHERDAVINNIHRSLKPSGMLFLRVPHRSSINAPCWEHYTYYGTSSYTGLCHGQNPNLPTFKCISVGVSMGQVADFYNPRTTVEIALEKILNKSFRLTDQFLCKLIGGVPEVQFMLQK
jgi:Methyltransferase domain